MSVLQHSFKSPCIVGIFGLFLVLPLSAPLIAQDAVNNSNITEKCQYYNRDCEQKGGKNCKGTEECDLSSEKKKAQCMVTWTNTSDAGVVVILKGCLYYDNSCKDRCISNDPANQKRIADALYCCCYGNNCNSDFAWEPKEPRTPDGPNQPLKIQGPRLALSVTFSILLCIFIVGPLIFYIYRRKKMTNFVELASVESTALTNSIPSPILGMRPIQLVEIKARGRFGAVWKAKYHAEFVAVKQFPIQDKESWNVEQQIYSLPQMNHSNLLQFIGVEKRGEHLNTEFWLISAYHEKGSLYDYLKRNVLTWQELCRIGLSMARGLSYLHSEQSASLSHGLKPSIAHRDFKSKNVLLKADLTACIADFGLAVTFYPGQSLGDTHGQVGTRRYMAPEVLEGSIYFHRDAFLPIDMYACGLVLSEIVSRCTEQELPIPEYHLPFEDEVGLHPTLDDMQECVVTYKKRPGVKASWLKHPGLRGIIEMMQECWDHDAEARLTAPCIVERFSKLPREIHTSQGY